MINVIKQEIDMEESLRKRLEIICDFCNATPTFINGSIRRIDKRVEAMIDAGLVDEVETLYKVYGENLRKINIIGYSEIKTIKMCFY